MKFFLIATAVVEATLGLALVASPSAPVSLLLGTELETPTATAVGRVAGVALLSLGTACWLGRRDQPERAATTLIVPMLLYNAGAVAILAFADFGSGLRGVALWPALALHVGIATWGTACLRTR
jgi:hypothetical protein